MNGQNRSSLYHLCVLLVIISGSALPAIDHARYRNGKKSKNLPATLIVLMTGCWRAVTGSRRFL